MSNAIGSKSINDGSEKTTTSKSRTIYERVIGLKNTSEAGESSSSSLLEAANKDSAALYGTMPVETNIKTASADKEKIDPAVVKKFEKIENDIINLDKQLNEYKNTKEARVKLEGNKDRDADASVLYSAMYKGKAFSKELDRISAKLRKMGGAFEEGSLEQKNLDSLNTKFDSLLLKYQKTTFA